MNDMYKDMKDFQVNAASFKAKLMKKLDELEQARKYQEELRKAEEVKKNKAQAEAKEKEDRIRQEEARRKEEEDRRRQEEARNAATKVQGVINGEKLVIFTEHKDTLIYLQERLSNSGYKVATIHGGKSVDERREAQNAFMRDDGECDGQNVGDGEEESEEIEIMGDFIDE